MGIGFGNSTVDAPSLITEGGGAISVSRLAFSLGHDVLLGFEGTSWSESSLNLSMIGVALYYYPGGSGLSLRGGAGFGSVEQGDWSLATVRRGAGFTVGMAWEFPTSRSFSVGPDLGYSYVSTDAIDAGYVSLGVAVTWRSRGRQ